MAEDVKKSKGQFNAASGAEAAKSEDAWKLVDAESEEYKALLRQNGWTINIESQDATVVAGQHNFISIKAPNGQTLYQLHGLGFSRQTGLENAAGELALRVAVTNSAPPEKITNSVVLMTGNAKEVFSTFAKALKLGEYTNNLKLDYIPVGIYGAGQNSNSVAHSAVKIMGFDVPESMMEGWAPGHDRLLIPHDISALKPYDGTLGEFPSLVVSLTREAIKQQLLEAQEPTGCDLRLFDPDQPYVVGEDLEIERTNCGYKPEFP